MNLLERVLIVGLVCNVVWVLMAWGLDIIFKWKMRRAKELTEWWDNLDIGGYSEIPLEAQAEYITRYRRIWNHYPWHMMKARNNDT